MNIFEEKNVSMPSWDERAVRTSLDQTDTYNKAKLPGAHNVPMRSVENITRPRRGHDV